MGATVNSLLAKLKSNQEYWNIMLHSIVTFLGQSTMQLVDLLFCRSLGSEASATVGTSSALFAWFMIVGIGLFSSLEYLIPHAIGEKNETRAFSFFYSGILLCILVGLGSTVCLMSVSSLVDNFGFNPAIAKGVQHFSVITALSYVPVFLVPVLRVELQTRGHSHEATKGLILGNLLNIFLNWVFIWGNLGSPAMGVMGSAIASVLSRYGILIFMLYRVYHFRRELHSPIHYKDVPYKKCTQEIIKLGFPISLHILFEMGAFVFVSTLAGRLIAAQNAAHAIVLSLASFSFMVPLGISSAASLTMSKALGEKKYDQVIKLGHMSLKLGLVCALFASLIYGVFRTELLNVYTVDAETVGVGVKLLLIVAIFQFGDALQVIFSGCLRGLGETGIQAKMNAAGHWLLGIPLGMYLGFHLKMEILGLWIGLCTGLWSVAIGLYFAWNRAVIRTRALAERV